MDLLLYLSIGFIIHVFILLIVYQKKFLRWPDGIIIAALISLVIFIANFIYWIILFSFFIPASVLTKANLERKKNKIISEKTGYRDALQVISNSLGLFIFALAQLVYSGINGGIMLIYLFSGTIFIASASADTWSTEIGTLNNSDPRYILNLRKKVPKGTSGGVSLLGNLGGLIGSSLISIILITSLAFAGILANLREILNIFIFITLLGFLGQILDSLLGALLQNKYYCPICKLNVEEDRHVICNSQNLKKIKKYTFLNNNTVNVTSNMCLSLVGFLLIIIIHFNPN